MIDFRLSSSSEVVRGEMREFLAENVSLELIERVYRTGVSSDPEFTQALVEAGWMAPAWPVELGGRGLDPIEMLVVSEELGRAEAPNYGPGVTLMVAAVIRKIGTDEQKAEIVPRALAGEITMVLGFSEPEAGSDLAAVTTRAERDGDQWVINGQKMFTTNAQIGDYVLLLTRTNTETAPHKGLTMFLVPMQQPGIEVQAVYTVSGERTNISFYNDVRVSDGYRIGGVDEGWHTLTAALGAEHGQGFAAYIARLLEAAEAWAAATINEHGTRRLDDPDVREALGRTAVDLEVSRLLQRRVAWMAETTLPITTQGPMSKLFSSEALKDRSQELVEIVGADALRSYFDPTAPQRGAIEHMLRHAVGTTIYAGTSEIHRNMIAQRGLGLPRTR